MVGLLQDVDAAHRFEATRSLLMAELQHRVKNILAVVQSVTERTLRGSTDLADFSTRFSGRLAALARTQGFLANRGTEGVELAQVVRDELAATSTGEHGTVAIEGPTVMLRDKAAEAVALALHELTTNAAKYGALSLAGGRLAVRWDVVEAEPGPMLSLSWREGGVALSGKPPRSGFGRHLIERGLPYDLGAATSLAFTPDGVHCTVQLPLGPFVEAFNRASPP